MNWCGISCLLHFGVGFVDLALYSKRHVVVRSTGPFFQSFSLDHGQKCYALRKYQYGESRVNSTVYFTEFVFKGDNLFGWFGICLHFLNQCF